MKSVVRSNLTTRIEVSLLNAPLGNLHELCQMLEKFGADGLHLDLMDGHFVEHLSFGIHFVQQIRSFCKLPIHVHLMTLNPEKYFFDLLQSGVNAVSFHCEAVNKGLSRLVSFLRCFHDITLTFY
ncbi:hypothetical protein [Candidatus Similichlamydia epinepheli]|uniref:hypothetical protein n=1 Tax=Candidatus Similichlamydia epinepheli TaxID=1903953 RepID=UPI000D3C40DB|nr:hypothetical protein [Candidatus Similichlamydia epinepheli]